MWVILAGVGIQRFFFYAKLIRDVPWRRACIDFRRFTACLTQLTFWISIDTYENVHSEPLQCSILHFWWRCPVGKCKSVGWECYVFTYTSMWYLGNLGEKFLLHLHFSTRSLICGRLKHTAPRYDRLLGTFKCPSSKAGREKFLPIEQCPTEWERERGVFYSIVFSQVSVLQVFQTRTNRIEVLLRVSIASMHSDPPLLVSSAVCKFKADSGSWSNRWASAGILKPVWFRLSPPRDDESELQRAIDSPRKLLQSSSDHKT